MRDYSVQGQGVTIPDDAIYKEVVVIGNGPSGIVLSYLLSGNWPYYNGAVHPDELLTARLSGAPPGRSIVQQDLRFLSQGLEGRSNNPVSLLMDTLNHPCADLGLELPSLLEWHHHPECQVEHIVLGKGPPGGSWQAMDGNILTISLGSWMELPGVEFRAWEASENAGVIGTISRDTRASVSSVARYYHDYVRTQNIAKCFRNGCVVTSVRPLDTSHSQNADTIDPETGVQYCQPQALWRVEGFDLTNNTPFCYISRRVVLATGQSDLPNRLGVPGEMANPSWVLHDLRALECALDRLVEEEEGDREGVPTQPRCDPVLIVGAGLSAADAVIAARFRSLPILHVFRKKADALGKQLPENMYPEYHKVHQMMGDGGASYPCYTALAEHRILEISSNRKVCVVGPDGTVSVHKVSVVAVLIGSRPDLNFLPPGLGLGAKPSEHVDCRSNPIHVDPYTHRVVRAPPGMYALGPLAGDNFVRFLQGGAVAITSHINKELTHHTVL